MECHKGFFFAAHVGILTKTHGYPNGAEFWSFISAPLAELIEGNPSPWAMRKPIHVQDTRSGPSRVIFVFSRGERDRESLICMSFICFFWAPSFPGASSSVFWLADLHFHFWCQSFILISFVTPQWFRIDGDRHSQKGGFLRGYFAKPIHGSG